MSEVIDPVFELITGDEVIYEMFAGRSGFKGFLSSRRSACGVKAWDYPEILENKGQSFIAIRFSKIFKVKPEFRWQSVKEERVVVLVADVIYEKAVARAIEWSKKLMAEKENEFHDTGKAD